MKKKLRVGVLFGGRSGEHEVSLLSANSILKAIDPRKYEVVPIGISKEGRWLHDEAAHALLSGDAGLSALPTTSPDQNGGTASSAKMVPMTLKGKVGLDGGDSVESTTVSFAAVAASASTSKVVPHTLKGKVGLDGADSAAAPSARTLKGKVGVDGSDSVESSSMSFAAVAASTTTSKIVTHSLKGKVGINGADSSAQPQALTIHAAAAGAESAGMDVVFPVLHGTFGEDGTIQGLFELADVAYVGSGVLGSAAGMDKDAMKKMFASAGLPMVKHLTFLRGEWKSGPRKCVKTIEEKVKYPVFVEPANLGSSVGISKVHDRSELAAAMDLAASYDRKIVIEEGVGGSGKARLTGKARELEVAVLGNDTPVASVVGEIVPDREFYDYESKYDSTSTSEPVIPAKLTKAQSKAIREMAVAAFKACDCA